MNGGANDLVDKLRDGVNNITGEADGSNYDRQQAYNKKVAADAANALATNIANTNASNQRDDVAASSGAAGIRNTAAVQAGAAGSGGGSLTIVHVAQPNSIGGNSDEKDFLGR